MANATQLPLLVTGAAGHLGRRVVAHLLDTHQIPANQIIATTRKPEALADLAAKGVVVRKADFEDPATLAGAFAGAQRLLLISSDALDRPGRRLAQHRNAVDAAVKAGVKHVVYTSMPKPEPGNPVTFAPDHYATEQALAASGLGWTVLRNSWYFDNLFMHLSHTLASGQWFTATGEGRAANLSREDCARAAAAAVASGSTANARYDITGTEALTTAETAQIISEVTGKPIQVIQVTPEQLRQGLAPAKLPDFVVDMLVSFDANTRAGNMSLVTDAVKQLTGKAPQTLRDFIAAHKTVLAG